MTDDVQQLPPSAPQPSDDPLANLEDLLQKAKAKRAGNSPVDGALVEAAAGPSPEEIQAQQLAEQQAQLALQEEQGEILRKEQLAAQRQKMAEELQNTPQYQARKEQDQEESEKADAAKAAHQGHIIHQVGETKI